jgi:RNA chaperone Hfq
MITQDDLLNNNSLIENFLIKAKEDKMVNRLFLINAIKLEGSLVDFDEKNVLISVHDNSLTMVYAHAISSLSQTENNARIPMFKRGEHSLESDFFELCKGFINTNVYLINGIKLNGKVVAFDDLSLLMEGKYNGNKTSQVIMKAAIASITSN